MLCICGHCEDEHEMETGPCSGSHPDPRTGRTEACLCVMFESDEDEDEEDR